MSYSQHPLGPDPYRGDPYRGDQYPAPGYGAPGHPGSGYPSPGQPGVGYPTAGQPGPAAPSSRPVGARTVLGALVWLAVLWGLVLLIAHGGLGTMTGQALDEAALQQAEADRNTFFPGPVLVAAQLLPEVVAVAAGLLALVWAVRHRRWIAAPCALAAVVAANLTTQVLKHGVFDKPDLGVQQIASNSLPSGHTTAAASLLMAALLVAPAHRRARAGRWGAFTAALVGMTTVLNGWHRPTDAVAALLIVGGWGVVAALVAQLLDAALARTRAGTSPARAYQRLREDRSRRRQERAWSTDRGDSAWVPPAHERDALQRERAASSSVRRNAPRNAGWGGVEPWQVVPYGPGAPVRPRLGTAITLTVLTAVLLAVAVWWPYPTLAGTFAGRITLTAGYLGIASAAALGWSVVSRRLRPVRR
ncbi:phosphatase PAP2 family protein [Kocuria rhizophila]|uniref:phosphatase PAP2 family protein n=1 Tax=Kocuria rhizophila TaxID=72000 RepID=UPI000F703368|nr:phosphatase PAP2 family protein [Kocuria rhizophila]VEH75855.1 PAP2 superfamily [Kocuria rhizophila]